LSYIEKLLHLIDMQIDFVERQLVSQNNDENEPQLEKIRWHGTQIEFVELIYALYEAGCFGKATLKKAFLLIGGLFDCEIPNYYRLFWDIRSRVAEERTFFLNRLKTKLLEKLARMDV